MRIQIANPGAHATFLHLPWERPLAEWPRRLLAGKPGGLHRHIVRYVGDGDALYAVKELPVPLARREYGLLRELASLGLPCVEVVGVVTDRGAGADDQGALITRYLDFALPYRLILSDRHSATLPGRVLDGLIGLLVRLHLLGFWWGDCSLSNTLFRRDAGALVAYVVDVETGELHPSLSDGQRALDLEIAVENIAGGLIDLQAAGRFDPDTDVLELVSGVEQGYQALWGELTESAIVDPDDTLAMEAKLRRLNDLGFDVEEMEISRTEEGSAVRITPRVVELGFHSRRLAALTGLQASENQALRLLNDIREFGRCMVRVPGRSYPEMVIAHRWLEEVFDPAIDALDPAQRSKMQPAELFHQLLEHRWFLSEQAGHYVETEDAARSFQERVLRHAPDERTVEVEELS